MFNPETFLATPVSGANSTEYVPVPTGEYFAYIEEVKARPWQSKDQSQAGMALDVLWVIDSPEVAALLNRDTVKCKQGLMLDFTDAGALDMGKGRNVDLGRLREAVGQNDPSQPWSPQMLVGKQAKVKVSHRADKDDPKKMYAEIREVAKR